MNAYLPIQWNFSDSPCDGLNGPPVDDGGTIYVCREEDYDEYIDNYDIDNPDETPIIAIKTSFADLVGDVIDGHMRGDGTIDPEAVVILRKIQDALRAAAGMIDSVL